MSNLADFVTLKNFKLNIFFNSRLTAGLFFLSSLVFCEISQAAQLVTGSFYSTTGGGRGGVKTFLNTYSYNVDEGVRDTSRPSRSIWAKTNKSDNPITKQTNDTKRINVGTGFNWDLINLSFEAEYTASDTETYTISPWHRGVLSFFWIGDKILPGGTMEKQRVKSQSDPTPIGAASTLRIGSGFYSYIGEYEYSETAIPRTEPIPEPFTILGAGTALGFGALFKRKLSKKQQKETTKV